MEKEHYEFEVAEDDKSKRLDKFLVEKLPKNLSRSFIQKLVAAGDVTISGKSVKCHHRVDRGEIVEVTVPPPSGSAIKAEEIPLKIVYEDKEVVVVDKPTGMVVHPAPGNYTGTLVNALMSHCKNLSGIGGVLKPGIVHRIDKGTSGIIVAAKTDEAHKKLARQFKNKSIKRIYLAIVKGVVQLDNGIVDLPIGRSTRDRKKMAVDFVRSKEAITNYKVIQRSKDCTLLELTLGTGRTHQIRVHMSYIGHPLLGDDKYGTKNEFGRPALHAKLLGFIHPTTNKYMEFISDMPPDMKELIKKKLL